MIEHVYNRLKLGLPTPETACMKVVEGLMMYENCISNAQLSASTQPEGPASTLIQDEN